MTTFSIDAAVATAFPAALIAIVTAEGLAARRRERPPHRVLAHRLPHLRHEPPAHPAEPLSTAAPERQYQPPAASEILGAQPNCATGEVIKPCAKP